MKVILLQDIPKLGKKYEIRDVSDGYARNFLLPRKVVEPATLQNIQKFETIKKRMEKEREEKIEVFKQYAEKIAHLKIGFVLKTDDKGSIFGAVNENDIVERLKKEGIVIEPEQIQLLKHLKALGKHLVKIKFSSEIEAELKIEIKTEKKTK